MSKLSAQGVLRSSIIRASQSSVMQKKKKKKSQGHIGLCMLLHLVLKGIRIWQTRKKSNREKKRGEAERKKV